MEIIRELWSAFSDIYFDPEPHTYVDSAGNQYKSVTTFVGDFCEEEFNAQEAALNCINSTKPETQKKYAGKTVEQLIEEWDRVGAYARALGTEIHSVMENLWYRKDYQGDPAVFAKFPEMKADFESRKKYCKQLYEKLKRVYVPIKNELIVYDADNLLCGTIDFLAYNKQKNCYSILDWKTSKSLDLSKPGKKLLAPFDQYDACNVNEYSIQLSTYAWIVEKHTNIKIDEMILFQIPKASTIPVFANCNDLRPCLNKILK